MKYAFIFTIGNGKVVWSGESEDKVLSRTTLSAKDRKDLKEFFKTAKPGYLIELEYDVVVCTGE